MSNMNSVITPGYLLGLESWSEIEYLKIEVMILNTSNSEVPNTSQAHSTPPPQYLHGRGESPFSMPPPYEDSSAIQVTANANPLPSFRSQVSLPSHSLHHSDCWIWSHLHHQWLMLFQWDHLSMLWRCWLGFSFLFLWIHPKLLYPWTMLQDLLPRPISSQIHQCLLDKIICNQCQLEKILSKWWYWRWRSGQWHNGLNKWHGHSRLECSYGC